MEKVLTLVAIVVAKEEQSSFVEHEIIKLIDPTRAEKGCLSYNLHRDNNDPKRFVLVENWETHTLWQQHMESKHMVNYAAVTKDAVESWELIELTRVD